MGAREKDRRIRCNFSVAGELKKAFQGIVIAAIRACRGEEGGINVEVVKNDGKVLPNDVDETRTSIPMLADKLDVMSI